MIEPAHRTAEAFLEAWAEGDYETMYALCASDVRAAVPFSEFTRIYNAVADESTVIAYRPTLRGVLENEREAQAAFDLEVETSFVGTFQVDNELPLVREENAVRTARWAVLWSKRCIYRELTEDNLVHMVARATVRANIYDATGKGLASEGSKVIVGVVPGEIEDEPALLSRLSLVLDLPQGRDQGPLRGPAGNLVYPHRRHVAGREPRALRAAEHGTGHLAARARRARVPRPGRARRTSSATWAISRPKRSASWQALGYAGDELVGRTGIEAWGEPFLAGQRGGELTIITPGGQAVTTLARREAIPARSIYLTLEYEFQRAVEDLLGERKGAVVVMDVRDGRVLAMATWPRYDPNLFAEGIAPQDWSVLVNDADRPLLNRRHTGPIPARLDLQDRDHGHGHGAGRRRAHADLQLPRHVGQAGLAADLLAQERARDDRPGQRADRVVRRDLLPDRL